MPGSRHFRRGFYLMPTLFTLGNMFCGFSSVVQTSLGGLELAAALIIIAAVLDGMDGRIARLTGTTSAFGLEFDSLADIVSFGMAPAMLAHRWALEAIGPGGRIGWALAFLYLVCAATRLARYNIQSASGDKRHFVGLPSPMGGSMLASVVYAFPERPDTRWVEVTAAIGVVAIAVLMVSRFRYRSFREIDLRSRRSYRWILPIAALLVAVVVHPASALLSLAAIYLASAPIAYAWNRLSGRGTPAGPSPESRHAAEVVDEPALR
jgi:CDP-diacylglycerol---serine O-phosphatidyltransferase